MKFKSSIGDGAFLGLVVYSLLTLAMFIFWVVSGLWWPAIALTAVLFIVILPIYFGTSYTLNRDELEVCCGVVVKVIPYRMIISATDADCVSPSFALSHKRICLRYLDGEDIKMLYLSPMDRNVFRDALNNAMQKSVATLKSRGDLANIEAIEEAKGRLAKEHERTRAEERAIEIAEAEAKEKANEDLAREIKKLDDIIDGNIEPEDVVLSQEQEDKLYARRKAEKKLLAKVRKLKDKKDKETARQLLIDKYNNEVAEKEEKVKKEEKIKEEPKKVEKEVVKKEPATKEQKALEKKAKIDAKKDAKNAKKLEAEKARQKEIEATNSQKDEEKKAKENIKALKAEAKRKKIEEAVKIQEQKNAEKEAKNAKKLENKKAKKPEKKQEKEEESLDEIAPKSIVKKLEKAEKKLAQKKAAEEEKTTKTAEKEEAKAKKDEVAMRREIKRENKERAKDKKVEEKVLAKENKASKKEAKKKIKEVVKNTKNAEKQEAKDKKKASKNSNKI